jgi:hypothetical protein
MVEHVVVRVFHLNVFLVLSNVWVVYPVYSVVRTTAMSLMWKYSINTLLLTQSIVSAAQHITERNCSPHQMCGIPCTKNLEHGMLWADRVMAGIVSIVYAGMIWTHVGIRDFLCSWYALYLAWCLGLIYVSDNHIRDSPVSYTLVHFAWHISIYSFLGDVVQWIDELQ